MSARVAPDGALPASDIPQNANEADDSLYKKVFWDDIAKRPLRINKQDVAFAKKVGVPLSNVFYSRRLQDNFSYMSYRGPNRVTTCGKSGVSIETNWPSKFDGRILCEEEYLEVVG